MAKITVYTTSGCSHCMKVKKLLQNKQVLFSEINLAEYPEKRDDMITKTGGKKTVPQIFFEDQYIGDANTILQLELDSLLDEKLSALGLLKDRASVNANSTSEIPTKMEEEFDMGASDRILPELYFELIERNSKLERTKRWPSNIKTFKACDLVEWLISIKKMTPSEASGFGQKLCDLKIIQCIKPLGHGTFTNAKGAFWAFQIDIDRHVLNRHIIWESATRKAEEIARDLQLIMASISDKYISQDGKGIDYTTINKSKLYHDYLAIAIQLQTVDLSTMDHNTAMSFWLNLYNAMIIHANIAIGSPKNAFQRAKLFSTFGYLIGGSHFTLSVIEHGILRANKMPPNSYRKVLNKQDPRIKFAMNKVDPRIHFALVCGAKSCPPIRIYSPHNVDSALEWAAEAFISEEVKIDEKKKRITMSMLFKWYQKDFGSNRKEFFNFLFKYFSPSQRESFLTLIANHSSKMNVTINYFTYNWDSNNRYNANSDDIKDQRNFICSDDDNYSDDDSSSGNEQSNELDLISPSFHNFMESCKILWDSIEWGSVIKSGENSQIYKGKWEGNKVIIKRIIILKDDINRNALQKKYMHEANMLKLFNHPNILQYYGSVIKPPYYCIVTEYAPLGNLHDYLKSNQTNFDQVLKLAQDIAKGMKEIHQKGILHRDLKSLNIVIDASRNPKIADFGECCKLSDINKSNEQYLGTINWTAPEIVFHKTTYTKSADVYSFGMVMWELMTKKFPFDGLDSHHVAKELKHGNRPTFPNVHENNSSTSDQTCAAENNQNQKENRFILLAQSCWNDQWTKRPSFEEILYKLDLIINNEHDDSTNVSETEIACDEFSCSLIEDIKEIKTPTQKTANPC